MTISDILARQSYRTTIRAPPLKVHGPLFRTKFSERSDGNSSRYLFVTSLNLLVVKMWNFKT
jgi:hypothetical protein